MPRYFFHIEQDDHIICDDRGLDLDNIEEIQEEVIEIFREIVIEFAIDGRVDHGSFVIEDSEGKRVLVFPFWRGLSG